MLMHRENDYYGNVTIQLRMCAQCSLSFFKDLSTNKETLMYKIKRYRQYYNACMHARISIPVLHTINIWVCMDCHVLLDVIPCNSIVD